MGEERDKEPLGGRGTESEGGERAVGRETSFLMIPREVHSFKKFICIHI